MKIRFIILMAILVLILGVSFLLQEASLKRQNETIAYNTAKTFYQQLVINSNWNAKQIFDRDNDSGRIKDGKGLSHESVTQAVVKQTSSAQSDCMIRNIVVPSETTGQGVNFHVTSLRAINPENKPALWEKEWLREFEKGVNEQSDIAHFNGSAWYRYMAPLYLMPSCMGCHATEGYEVGDVRGGISILLPYSTDGQLFSFVVFIGVVALGLVFVLMGGGLLNRQQLLFDATLNHAVPICITDKKFNIIKANKAYWNAFGEPDNDGKKQIKCYDHRPGLNCHTDGCPLKRILNGEETCVCDSSKAKDKSELHFIITATPLKNSKGDPVGVVECFQDITEKKRLEKEKEQSIADLKSSLEKVKLLSGLIPICASCKKIRDDKGYWSQVELYIKERSEAEFSHGICPDCVTKLYSKHNIDPELID